MPEPQTMNLLLTVVGSLLVGLCLLTQIIVLYGKWRRRQTEVSTPPPEAALQTPEVLEATPEVPLDDDVSLEIQQNLSSLGEQVEGRIENRLELLDELVTEADREIENLSEILEEIRPNARVQSFGEEAPHEFDWSDAAPNRPAFDATHRNMIGCLHQAGYSAGDIASLTGSREAAVEAVLRPIDRDAA